MCTFTTNITAVTVSSEYTPKSPEINFRIAQSSFSLNTSDQQTKVVSFEGRPHGSWMLWKTKFQINFYHTMSSDKNFIKNLDKIVLYEPGETFHGTISETQTGNGNEKMGMKPYGPHSHSLSLSLCSVNSTQQNT